MGVGIQIRSICMPTRAVVSPSTQTHSSRTRRPAYFGNGCSSALAPAGSAVRATFIIMALNV